MNNAWLAAEKQDVPTKVSDKLVTIATFNQAPGAYIAKALLEEEGIEGFIANEHVVNTNWFRSLAVGGTKLQVRESGAKRIQSEARKSERSL